MTGPAGPGYPCTVTSELTITGMLGPPAVRAAFTALGAVPGVTRAQVVPGRAVLEHDGPLALEPLREALALVGLGVGDVTTRRTLPLAEGAGGADGSPSL